MHTAAQLTGRSLITINGIVNVSGTLRTVNSLPIAIRVESEGVLHVKESGTVILDRE